MYFLMIFLFFVFKLIFNHMIDLRFKIFVFHISVDSDLFRYSLSMRPKENKHETYH